MSEETFLPLKTLRSGETESTFWVDCVLLNVAFAYDDVRTASSLCFSLFLSLGAYGAKTAGGKLAYGKNTFIF